MIEPFEQSTIQSFTDSHSNWTVADDALCGEFKFKDFTQAFGFLSQVAILMEKQNHHAHIENMYNSVTLILTTHDAGNKITERDTKLAKAIEGIFK